MSKIMTRAHFKLPANPWAKLNLRTADLARVQAMVKAAVETQELVSILGPRGSGKTRALGRALATHDVTVITAGCLDRERLTIGDIETEIILSLSGETVRRSRVHRSHQMKRLLGEESARGPVVLVIDDAHVLHRQTVRALKRLRELEWLRRSPLLGIVLLGQQDPTHAVDEVRLRSDRLWMEGLTRAEAKRALESALGSVIEPQAAGLVSKHSGARNWLGLIEAADRCLAAAAVKGGRRIDAQTVRDALGAPRDEAEEERPADGRAVSNYLRGAAA